MTENKNIFSQEPQMEAVNADNEMKVNGYVAYINLDWLDFIFADNGWQGEYEKQKEFIDEMQQGIADVVLKQKERNDVMWSWSWYDKEGQLHRAVEVMPVAAAAKGLTIVTPDVTGYEELKGKIKEQWRTIIELQCAINKLYKEKDRLNNRIDSAMLDRVNPSEWVGL